MNNYFVTYTILVRTLLLVLTQTDRVWTKWHPLHCSLTVSSTTIARSEYVKGKVEAASARA